VEELNNCCGTTCDKAVAKAHFEDALAIAARLATENERLKRQINDMAQSACHNRRDDDFFKEIRHTVYTVLVFIALANFFMWLQPCAN